MKKYEDIYEPSYEIDDGVKAVYETTHLDTPYDPLGKASQLLQGAIDFHCHCGPCAKVARSFNDIEYGIEATRAGMAAIVNKGLTFPTARSAVLAQYVVDQWAKEHNMKGCKIIGGVTLSYSVGGLNAEAVETAARFSGKFVWTPVLDSAHHRRVEALVGMGSSGGIEVIDEKDKVPPELNEIFKLIAEYDMVLSLAHHSTRERFVMIDCAKEAGVKRISIIHPFQHLTKMTIEQMKTATEKGAYIEHLFFDLTPYSWDWDETIEAIKVVGADHFVLGTDGGRWSVPPPVPVYRIMIGRLLERGVSKKDIEKMVRLNAERLIWGEP
jgi:predicted metal-dependent TIM-barrel fold hydrolase